MHKATIIFVLAVISSFLIYRNHVIGVAQSKPSVCKDCNVVIIDIDVLRADELSCYGYHRNTTPNICKLAEKGSVFERNYTQYVWTVPSSLSTMVSQYASVHGVRNYWDKLSNQVSTLAELFKIKGYQTYWVADPDTWTATRGFGGERGFDKISFNHWETQEWYQAFKEIEKKSNKPFFIHFYTKELHIPYSIEADDKLIDEVRQPEAFPVTRKDHENSLAEYLVENYRDLFTDKAFKQHPEIFENVTMKNKDDLLAFFRTLPDDTDLVNDMWMLELNSYIRHAIDGGDEALNFMRVLYDTKLSQLDTKLGLLLEYLQTPLYEPKTIIVITSGNGEQFGEHGGFSHDFGLYNEILNTPLIVVIPGHEKQRLKEVTQNIDILPTLTEAVGISTPAQAQGKSLIPQIKGEAPTEIGYAISEKDGFGASIQNNEWKLTVPFFPLDLSSLELYHLEVDPGETKNVVDQNKDQADELLSRLKAALLSKLEKD